MSDIYGKNPFNGTMFKADFIPMGLSEQAEQERTSIYMACRKMFKKEIRGEMKKAQEEELKRKRKTQVRAAFVGKRKKSVVLEEESDKPISDSSHESEIYR